MTSGSVTHRQGKTCFITPGKGSDVKKQEKKKVMKEENEHAYVPKPSKSRSSLMTISSSESPGDPFTVIFSPSLLMKWTVTLLSDLRHTNKKTDFLPHIY